MKRVKSKRTPRIRCATCGESKPSYDMVSCGSIEGGYRQICNQCVNTAVALAQGLDKFEHVNFEPVKIADCSGTQHTFHFRTRLFIPGVAIDAFELRGGSPGGYEFQVIGDPEDDMLALLGRLIEKIRRALSVKHIEKGDLGPRIADHQIVRGRIAWDDDYDGRLPLVIVDGRALAWQELGRMLMTYEGWQFKLEIRGMSDEV